jgi:(R,R)-butanediol dehydrogenase/meso-butanediol dehydrogenase/diacetyl reductase
MKAAVFHGPQDVRIEDVAEPGDPTDGDVVLEVLRAAICGTDASEWDHGPVLCRPGVVLGHEFVGRVKAIGSGVETLHVGDRVVSGAGISCGHCNWCRAGRTNLCAAYRTLGLQVNGGLAEFVTSPASICRVVPERVDDDAAAMTQPLAVALHALSRVGMQRDESVAIVGVGGIGSFIVAGAANRASEGRVVAVDIDEQRLATALALGANQAVNASNRDLGELLLDLTDGVGFDVVIEASGAPHAPAAAVKGARSGGRALFVGLHGAPRELELTPMILREVDVFTTVAHVCDTDIPAALSLLAESAVASVTAGPCIPLDELVAEGLRPLAERRATGKILVAPR